jgi:hypothetical protein
MREGVKLALQLRERPHRRLVCQVALERLVQALDLAAGLGVVGPRVLGGDPQPLELDLQEHLAAPRGRGEDSAVVAEQGGRPVHGDRPPKDLHDVGCLHGRVGAGGQEQAGVVVDHVEDLSTPFPGEAPVGDVGLPHLVG